METPQERLREAMASKGMSVNVVADKAKMDRSGLRRILRGGYKRGCYLETWERLANAIGVDVVYLVRGA